MENTAISAVKEKPTKTLKVYEKKSTFKGATENDKWYSATLSTGESVTIYFTENLLEKKQEVVGNAKAFEIYNCIGNMKKSTVEKNGEAYINLKYYLTDCSFQEIQGEELPL